MICTSSALYAFVPRSIRLVASGSAADAIVVPASVTDAEYERICRLLNLPPTSARWMRNAAPSSVTSRPAACSASISEHTRFPLRHEIRCDTGPAVVPSGLLCRYKPDGRCYRSPVSLRDRTELTALLKRVEGHRKRIRELQEELALLMQKIARVGSRTTSDEGTRKGGPPRRYK